MADDASAPLAAPTKPVRHRFTGQDVLLMIEAGILPEKARVTLRGGELIDLHAEGSLHFNVKSDLIQAISVQAHGRIASARMGRCACRTMNGRSPTCS